MNEMLKWHVFVQLQGVQHHFHVQHRVLEPAQSRDKKQRASKKTTSGHLTSSSSTMHQSKSWQYCMYKILMNEYKIFYLYKTQETTYISKHSYTTSSIYEHFCNYSIE